MNNGLFDPAILSFVFAPVAITAAIFVVLWRRWMRDHRAGLDGPGLLLVSAIRAMPAEHTDWGAAMTSELRAVRGSFARWRFAFGCTRAALFPPPTATLLATAGRSPVCGLLSVALPPLGLPFLYFAAVIIEAISLYTPSRWTSPNAATILVKPLLVLTMGLLVAGVPLGVAGWLRRERLRRLAVCGMALSAATLSYFWTVMYFIAGAD